MYTELIRVYLCSMRKRFRLENIHIEDISTEGKGVGRHEGQVVFVERAVPGDIVDVDVYKKKKSFLEGRTAELKQPSADRRQAKCIHFGTCGGCKWQNLSYEAQLRFKQKFVTDAITRIGKIDTNILPIIPSPREFHYRNKLEFTFSNRKWLTDLREKPDEWNKDQNALGFHLPGLFDKILDLEQCHLQPEPVNVIRSAFKSIAQEHEIPFYDIRKRTGWLRNLVLRCTDQGDWLVLVSVTKRDDKLLSLFFDKLSEEFKMVSTWAFVVNDKPNDSIADLEVQIYKGRGYLEEQLGDLKFKVSPKSFFQTNTLQAKQLYDVVKKYAALKGNETVYDLYCGTGTITNYVASGAKQVIGLEYVSESVKDAVENSRLNGISNTAFFSGDMKDLLTESFFQLHGKPHLIITDPPRAGMHESVVLQLLNAGSEKIVYVSCNASTQARDMAMLESKYRVVEVQPVDMFPHTAHVESVALLQLR